ncbi:MAG: aminotransferase class III-fold pyridoxal phosphate-dependent enzyme, partial [archaeon]
MLTGEQTIKILGKYLLLDGFGIVFDFKKSHGSWMYDLRGKREILDLGYNHFSSHTLAYNHPGLKEKKYLEKLKEVSEFRVALSDVYHPYQAEFVQEFSKILPKGFNHLFFVDNGAPAVENALKVAFDWKTRKNGGLEADLVIHFRDAFHGRLGYTLSLTNTADPRKYLYFPKFKEWPRIHNPKAKFDSQGKLLGYEDEGKAIEEINEAIEKYGKRIAALIIEPVQGEGGDNYFNPSFFKELRNICDQKEIMLIFDEVQTGWSLGDWWASGTKIAGGVLPDVFAFSKKTQQAGIAANSRVDEVEKNVFQESSRINSTWGGNLPDMVRATQYIRIIKKEKLHKNVLKQGAYLKKLFSEEDLKIDNLRGVGGWLAFDLPTPELRDIVWKKAFELGCLVLKCGVKSIRIRLNLSVTKEEIEKGYEILREAIKETWKTQH